MSFDPSKPANNQSPALFPAENRANMLRLETLLGQDHQFNDPPAANDGWHKVIHWVQQGSSNIDPLNPSAAAPNNAGGPAIAWEQLDTYGVPRVWLRSANGGNVQSMTGFTEIRVNGFSVTSAYQTLLTPPQNTWGTIFYQGPVISLGLLGGMGTYWKVGANMLSQMSIPIADGTTVSAGSISFEPITGITPNITVKLTTGVTPLLYDFRILYRYI